jgi:UDP-N-acetylmuramyl pentapeptide phosphotransferase/UDP-N-acetylglucosamine-1-phosphate transferase
MIVLITAPLLFLLNLIYLQFGTHYKIFARKQDQSRRSKIVTGAGIVFLFAWLLYFAFNDFTQPSFLFILFIAGLIGLIDDIWSVPIFLQLVVHVFLFTLLLNELQLLQSLSIFQLLAIYLFAFGFLFVVAKHDGINGLLTSSALIFFGTTMFILPGMLSLAITNPILYIIFVLLAFGWYNFKDKAQLFMGTTGRILLAYLMLFMLLHMVFSLSLVNPELGENQKLDFKPQYLLLLTILVIDLLQAIARNLFSGKRLGKLPLAYLLLKENNFSIYTIALIYAGLQLLVNVAILSVF